MPKSTALDTAFLNLLFKGTIDTIFINIAAAAASPLTNLYVALHTANPGGGTQNTSEPTYIGYARVAVTRGAGWTLTGASISPTAAISFPTCPTGTTTATATYASIGIASSGATQILYSGALSPTIPIMDGVTPQINITSTIIET
ncbi:MAG: hypothetical protein JHC33_02860 [Ignisphaera sp.]|nr:hypothetical protein [Ignisphaera sp.]